MERHARPVSGVAVQSARPLISAQKMAGYGVAAVAAVLVLYPVFFLFQAALDVGDPQVRPPTAYGFDNFSGILQYPQILLNTLTVSVAATVMALVFGFVMAWILTRTNVPGRRGAPIFVFAEMLGSFAAALVLGLPSRYYVITTAIYQMVQQYPPKIQIAAAMGVSLFAVMFFMLFLYRRIVMAGSYVTITGKAFRPRVADVGPLRYVLLAVCLLYLLAAVGLPLA